MSEFELICNSKGSYKPLVIVGAQITIYAVILLVEWNQLHDGIHSTKDNSKFTCHCVLAAVTKTIVKFLPRLVWLH